MELPLPNQVSKYINRIWLPLLISSAFATNVSQAQNLIQLNQLLKRATVLLEEGTFYLEEFAFEKAVLYLDSACLLLKPAAQSAPLPYAEALQRKAYYFVQTGQILKAIQLYESILKIRQESLGASHLLVADVYNNLGNQYARLSDFSTSLDFHFQALRIRKSIGAHEEELAQSYFNIGNIYTKMGNIQAALDYYDKSINIAPTPAFSAKVYNSYGSLYFSEENLEQALIYHQKALSIRKNSFKDFHPEIAQSLTNIGNCYTAAQQYEKAVKAFEEAELILKKIYGNRHPALAKAYNNLGSCYLECKNYLAALTAYNQALEALNFKEEESQDFRRFSTPIDLLTILFSKGQLLQQQFEQSKDINHLKQSLKSYRNAGKLIENLRMGYHSTGSKLWLNGFINRVFEQAIEACFLMANSNQLTPGEEKVYVEEAFQYAEKNKAFVLLESVRAMQTKQFSGLPDSVIQKEQLFQQLITEKERQIYLIKHSSDSLQTSITDHLKEELFVLDQRFKTFKGQLQEKYPNYFRAFYNVEPISIKKIQKDLIDENQMLIEYFLGANQLFIFSITKTEINLTAQNLELPLENWVNRFRKSIDSYTQQGLNQNKTLENYQKSAHLLYSILLKSPLQNHDSIEELIIIPDGVLGYLPFSGFLSALPPSNASFNRYPFLLQKYQISYCFSARLLHEIKNYKTSSYEHNLLAIAPSFNQDSRGLELLQNKVEVECILKSIQGEVLLDQEATLPSFIEKINTNRYQIIHFASHAEVNDWTGAFSWLALTEIEDTIDNEAIYAQDLYHLTLPSELVVLSACKTGVGELRIGEGIISLARGFFYAGAKSILTSLWNVNDDATAIIMGFFYQNLKKGQSKNSALRNAKLRFLEEYPAESHPYFWASFVILGDEKDLNLSSKTQFLHYFFLFLISGMLVLFFFIGRILATSKAM